MIGKTGQWLMVFWLITLLVSLSLGDAWRRSTASVELDYSDFLVQLGSDNILELEVGVNLLRGRLKRPLEGGQLRFTTRRIDPALATQLDGVDALRFRAAQESGWGQQLIGWIGPTLLLILFWLLLFRGTSLGAGAGAPGKGLLSVGRSRARVDSRPRSG